ncbi:MAG: tRNA epoxyqueuosine(34) reductase QueG [Thermodesulfobacteriota bacterium]
MDVVSTLSERAKALGFVAIGFLEPQRPPHFDQFLAWLARRKHGGLAWLDKNTELREHPEKLLEGCRAILSMAYPYPARRPATPDGFTVARYADPSREDYHLRLPSLCREMVKDLEEAFPGCRSRILVDSAPILERSIAHASGLGFLGKNNLLIVPGHGSFLYLCEILTTAPLQFPPAETVDCLCGDCSRCLEACPAGALESPFTLDVARCLSYLTVEHRGELVLDAGSRMNGCFLGCDRCQEACPYNGPAEAVRISLPPAYEILAMDKQEFKRRFRKTALARAGIERLKRNIRAIQISGRRPSFPD